MLLLVPTAREARLLFDSGKAPRCEDPESLEVAGRSVRAALVGFGPAAAGVLAALALTRERPRFALLVGVAGSYQIERAPVGGLFRASGARFSDLCARRGATGGGAESLGFEQAPPGPARTAVGDHLALPPVPGIPGLDMLPSGELLTVVSPSGSREEARERALAFPGALGEDMEGFAVALAAQRLGIPLAIVRGVSNAAGEADKSRWDVSLALKAVRAWLAAGLSQGGAGK